MAVDRRNGRRAELASSRVDRFELPDKPQDWSAEAVQAWDRFWCDPVATALTEADRVVLLRWADYLDRAIKALEKADQAPVVKGSMGQPVENPEYGIAARAQAVVEKCEAQLGIGALNRARLGIAITSERQSLAALNMQYAPRGTPDNASDSQEEDPRIIKGKLERDNSG